VENRLLILAALAVEARPWIDRRSMRRLPGTGSLQVFESEECVLCVTGTGPIAAAGATGWMLGRFPEIASVINFGCCGAPANAFPLGEVLLIHRIHDRFSGREFIPDILVSHPFRESPLQTWHRPVEVQDSAELPVDMEATAIFETARRMVPPHRMLFLKVVSDYFQPHLNRDSVTDWLNVAVKNIEDWLPAWPAVEYQDLALQDEDLIQCEQWAALWQLSASQTHQLRHLFLGIRARRGKVELLRERFQQRTPVNKQQRNQWFRDLCYELQH